MTKVYHFNCVDIETAQGAKAIGHCLLLEDEAGLALVDAGIGRLEVLHPEERLGQSLIDAVGFKLHPDQPMVVQLEANEWNPLEVQHCIATHLDCDHIGGLADFPGIQVHVSEEEWENFSSFNPRYLQRQMIGVSKVHTYGKSTERWLGLEARKVELGFSSAIYLVPLFGHTLGHCGVAIEQKDHWLFFVGDAYYSRMELQRDDHPVSQLAALRADDNAQRILSLDKIRKLLKELPDVEVFSAHDPGEFPQ